MSEQPLRVLQVLQGLGTGGAERLQVTLARAVDRDVIDLHVCCLSTTSDSLVADELQDEGVALHTLGAGRLRDPTSYRRLLQLVREHDFEVLHTHLSTSNILGVLVGTRTRRPVLSTMHNLSTLTDGHGPVHGYVETLAVRRASRVVAVAPEIRDDLVGNRRVAAARVVVVPNPVPISSERPNADAVQQVRRELLGDQPGPLVVTLGAVARRKAQEVMVAAMPLVLRQFPTARLAIVGRSGNNSGVVAERIGALGLERNVVCTGERADVDDILHAADLFVLSSATEGLPLSLLEAMAVGLPVVATAVGGVPRVVVNEETGLLVPPGDPDALGYAISRSLAMPGRSQAQAVAARERVQSDHRADRWAAQLAALYRAVVAERRARD